LCHARHTEKEPLIYKGSSVRETGLELREIGKRQVKPSYMAQFYNRKRQKQSIMHNREKRRVFLVVVNPYTIAMVMRYARVKKTLKGDHHYEPYWNHSR
jgi:hypothetical protein